MGEVNGDTSPHSGAAERIELGAHTLPYRAYPFERALEGIAGCGYRYVGIWNDHAGTSVVAPDAGEAEIEAVRRQIDRAGLIPRMAFRFRGASGDEAGQLRRTVEVAGALGIPFVISTGPSPYAGRAFEARKRDMLFLRQAQEYIATLRELAPLAERLGVTIVMKPHMGVTGTGEDLADLVEAIDHPAVRICYDAGNIAFYEGLVPEEDVKTCAHYVRTVCIKDHRGLRANLDFPLPGQGDVDHTAIFRTLLDAGFSGPALIERIDGLNSAEEIDQALRRAKDYLESAISQAQAQAKVRVTETTR
ncbi:MAG TPA: sugar phosphate isomerase/epimerase family protein [Chloroflexota bacterium]|nr:sugar phosphate isomerase/epimerase family protein [Chloroflexota bacterium]